MLKQQLRSLAESKSSVSKIPDLQFVDDIENLVSNDDGSEINKSNTNPSDEIERIKQMDESLQSMHMGRPQNWEPY